MKIIEAADRNPEFIQKLLEIWESAVRATHLFLSEQEIDKIKKYVPEALKDVPHLIIAKNENGLLGVTSGVGGLWGNYRRVSGTLDPDGSIEGTYGDEDTSIIVSDQMAKVTDDYVPGGADIATVTVHYNNGLTLEGRLYTQQDSSLAVVDPATNLVQGIMTFEGGKVTVAGSGFDGTYQKVG